MNPTNAISYLLGHTATIMNRQSDQVLQEQLGIGMSQFRLLMILLQRKHGVQQRTLADYLGQTEASVSRQIKLLLEKGMVAVEVNPDNRREHITIATAKGEKVWQAGQETLAQYHKPAFDHLDEGQRKRLDELLRILHLHYCQEGTPYVCDEQLR
jgi:DNA-binding MarR family transcriptional regulator